MGIFTADGRLQTGSADGSQRHQLAAALRKQNVQLCSPIGEDLSENIYQVLDMPDPSFLTDILLQADADGKYQAILLGGVETFQGDTTFHVIYLCSVVPRGGITLMEKVKQRLLTDKTIDSITLEPLQNVVDYYMKKLDFKLANGATLIWHPPRGGKRTRRKKLRKTRRKSKQ